MSAPATARTQRIQRDREAAARALIRGERATIERHEREAPLRDHAIVARETRHRGTLARALAGRDVGHVEHALHAVTALCASGAVDDALDHLLRAVDAWLDGGEERRCDLLCELMRLDHVDDSVPLALLGATIDRAPRLPHRDELVARLEAHLLGRHAPGEVRAMLEGLR